MERFNQEALSSLTNFTLPQILFKQAKELGSKKIAIREKMYGIWLSYNWQDYFRYTKNVALGLKALGLKRGENIGIITDNHPEWLFTEIGAQAVGCDHSQSVYLLRCKRADDDAESHSSRLCSGPRPRAGR